MREGHIAIYYGKGKGKTSIAVGRGMRAIGEDLLKNLCDLLKQLIHWSLKTLLTVFTTYIGITGAVSGTTDAATLKAAKITIAATGRIAPIFMVASTKFSTPNLLCAHNSSSPPPSFLQEPKHTAAIKTANNNLNCFMFMTSYYILIISLIYHGQR